MLKFADVFGKLKTVDDVRGFLEGIFSSRELRDAERRWVAIQLLIEGKSQRAASKAAGMSIASISRAASVSRRNLHLFKKVLASERNVTSELTRRQSTEPTRSGDRVVTVSGGALVGWTDERIELLQKLWAEGLSASQIAGELGGITRNTVIGAVHRLGLSGRARNPATVGRSKSRMTRVRSSHYNAAMAYDYEPEPELESIENIIPIGQRCTLLELSDQKCHWPIGDPGQPDFFFCGGKAIEGMPYCSYHSRMMNPALGRVSAPVRGKKPVRE